MFKKLALLLIIFSHFVSPQQVNSLHSLNLEIGGGYSYHLTDLNIPDINLHGFSGTFRIMWQPEHLLRVGIETGYQRLYTLDKIVNLTTLGKSEAQISMSAVPLLGVFSMVIFPEMLPEFELKFSAGVMFLNSKGSGFGSRASSSQVSLGFSGAATYLKPLSERISAGAELKYHNYAKINDGNLSLQILLSWKFMRW